MKLTPITDEAHWRQLRDAHIGASEDAALFDLLPYFTKFMLWNAKAGLARLPEPEHNRIDWGKVLEPAIAKGIAEAMRWTLEERNLYASSVETPGMGCTIDRWIVDHERGPGVVEIKNIDWLQWKQTWTETHAAPHVELQLQHQLAVTDFSWGAIGALVGGNDLVILEREPHRPTIERIKAAVEEFWRSVQENRPPDPFGSPLELDTLRQLCCPPEPKEIADLTGDYEAFEAARMFQWAREQVRFHEQAREAARVKLMHRVGKAGLVKLPGFDIRRNKLGYIHKCEMLPGAEPPAVDAPMVFL